MPVTAATAHQGTLWNEFSAGRRCLSAGRQLSEDAQPIRLLLSFNTDTIIANKTRICQVKERTLTRLPAKTGAQFDPSEPI